MACLLMVYRFPISRLKNNTYVSCNRQDFVAVIFLHRTRFDEWLLRAPIPRPQLTHERHFWRYELSVD